MSTRTTTTAVALVVTCLSLLPAAPALAAQPPSGDTVPAGSMIIAVTVPERSWAPTGPVTPGTAPGPLAVTGLDATSLWIAAFAAGGALALGGGAVGLSRRRRRP